MHNSGLEACSFMVILSQSKSRRHKTSDSDTFTNNTNIHITNYMQNTHIHRTKTHILIESQNTSRESMN